MMNHEQKMETMGLKPVCKQCSFVFAKTGKQCKNKSQCHLKDQEDFPLCRLHEYARKKDFNNETCPIQQKKLQKQEMFLLANLQMIDSIVAKMTDRMLITEKLMEKFCSPAEINISTDELVQKFRESEKVVEAKLAQCVAFYEKNKIISLEIVEDIQRYYYQDFLKLEHDLHQHLETQCKSKGKFPFVVNPNFPIRVTKSFVCDQKDASEDLTRWLFQIDDEYENKQLLCTLDPNAMVFEEGDLLPRGFEVVKKQDAFLGIARKKNALVVDTVTKSWPEYIAETSLKALSGIASSMFTLVQMGWNAIGSTAEILTMSYRNISFKMILCGMAISAGIMTLSYITDMGLQPIVQLAYYSESLCQMVTNPTLSVMMALLITSKLVNPNDKCAFAIQFGKIFLSIYGFRHYCSFLRFIGSKLFSTIAFTMPVPEIQSLVSEVNALGPLPEEASMANFTTNLNENQVVPKVTMSNSTNEISHATNMTLWVQEPTRFAMIVAFVKNVRMTVNPWITLASFVFGIGILSMYVLKGDYSNAAVSLVKLSTNGVISNPQAILDEFPQLSNEVMALGGLANIVPPNTVREAFTNAGLAISDYYQ